VVSIMQQFLVLFLDLDHVFWHFIIIYQDSAATPRRLSVVGSLFSDSLTGLHGKILLLIIQRSLLCSNISH